MEVPSKLLLCAEGIRSIYEYVLSSVLNPPLQFISTQGDGHPVMVIPGLGAADNSTMVLRRFLRDIGYETYTWGHGRNLGPKNGLDLLLKELADRVDLISSSSEGRSVSLVGWSLGGIYAREVAKLTPDNVRQVITLGTPFKGDAASTNATMLYELLSGDKSHKNPAIIERIKEPPPVPFTSLYSKTDGVVHWKCSIEDTGSAIENIEVSGSSHLGLGHNPISLYIIADRLSYNKDNWRPFR